MAVLPGSTRASVVFFSNFGVAYTSRIIEIPASTGYGEPIQRFFKLKDGERIVAAFSLDPRAAGDDHRPQGGGARRRFTPSRCRATATACASASSRSSSRARAPAAATGACPKAPSSSGVARSTGDEILIAATREARAMLTQGRRSELPVRARAAASS